MTINLRMRFEVLQRDGFCCRYCGERASQEVKLEVDHILPKAHGGKDEVGNLMAACRKCNQGKKAHPIPSLDGDLDPTTTMQAVCSAAMQLYGAFGEMWRGEHSDIEHIGAEMMGLYWAVMDHGDLAPDDPWYDWMQMVRANVAKAYAEDQREKGGR